MRIKWLGHEVDQSTPSSAEGKTECSYTATPSTCLRDVDTENILVEGGGDRIMWHSLGYESIYLL
jgi:hypothetical protein